MKALLITSVLSEMHVCTLKYKWALRTTPVKMEEGFLCSSDRWNKRKCSSSGAVCVVLSTSFSTKPSTIWKTAVEHEATLLSLSCRLHLEENTIVPLASSVPRDTKKALPLSYHVSKRHHVSPALRVFCFLSVVGNAIPLWLSWAKLLESWVTVKGFQ